MAKRDRFLGKAAHIIIPWRYLSKESSHFFSVGYFIEMFANLRFGYFLLIFSFNIVLFRSLFVD